MGYNPYGRTVDCGSNPLPFLVGKSEEAWTENLKVQSTLTR